jgi:hypothetical protein
VPQLQLLNKLTQRGGVQLVRVHVHTGKFVAFPETDKIWRDYTMPGFDERPNHLAV